MRFTVWNGSELVDQGMYIEANRIGQIEQFDDINPPPAALDRVNHGLITTELFCKFRLAQTGAFTLVDQYIDEAQLSW